MRSDVGADDYKHVECDINGCECDFRENDCSKCDVMYEMQKIKLKNFIETVTPSQKRRNGKTGIMYIINPMFTVAIYENIHDVSAVFLDFVHLKDTKYNPDSLKQYPMFFKVKQIMNLGIPRRILSRRNMIMVAVYDDKVVVSAPYNEQSGGEDCE